MGKRNRFVKPAVVRLEISDGDWIDVKRELNVKERKRVQSAGMTHMQSENPDSEEAKVEVRVNWIDMIFAKVREYLVDWSFTEPKLDDKGNEVLVDGVPELVPVEFSEAALSNLDDETFEEIKEALEKHEERLEKEKKAAKAKT